MIEIFLIILGDVWEIYKYGRYSRSKLITNRIEIVYKFIPYPPTSKGRGYEKEMIIINIPKQLLKYNQFIH